MVDTPPQNPNVNDIWIDNGVMKRWDGKGWFPYLDVLDPEGPSLEPLAVEKKDDEEGGHDS